MGASVATVKNWICESGLTGMRKRGTKQAGKRKKPDKQKVEVQTVEMIESNADRHKCRTCKYRDDPAASRGGCNYLGIVGHSRGCRVEDCNVYEKGKKVTKKEAMRLREV